MGSGILVAIGTVIALIGAVMFLVGLVPSICPVACPPPDLPLISGGVITMIIGGGAGVVGAAT